MWYLKFIIKYDEIIANYDSFNSLQQSALDSYYKLRELFYYKVRHWLLQIATGITKCDGFVTNTDDYY